jgi:hypothetical protein
MVTIQHKFNWKSTLWSAVLVLVIPLAITFLTLALYGTVIGFQSRGDTAFVNQQIRSLNTSAGFKLFYYGTIAITALWQCYSLVKKAPERAALHIAAALGLAALLFYLQGLLL